MLSVIHPHRIVFVLGSVAVFSCGPGGSDQPDSGMVREICGNGLDDNNDGQADEGCTCDTGRTQRCFIGDPSRAGMGPCQYGSQSCTGLATWAPCMGYGTDPSCQRPAGTNQDAMAMNNATGDNSSSNTGSSNGAFDAGTSNTDLGNVGGTINLDSGTGFGNTGGNSALDDTNKNRTGIQDCPCKEGGKRYCNATTGCSTSANIGGWGLQVCKDGVWSPCANTQNPIADPTAFNDAECTGDKYSQNCCVRAGFCCEDLGNMPHHNHPGEDRTSNGGNGECMNIIMSTGNCKEDTMCFNN